jgi:hypothetical protein
MKTNVGIIDRIIRILVALVIFGLYYLEIVSGTLGLVLLIFTVVLLVTALVCTCPVYKVLGISTQKKTEECWHIHSKKHNGHEE